MLFRSFFPFITGKGFAFRITVEIIFASWILLFLRNQDYLPKWSSVQVLFTTFTVVLLIADILGVGFLRSFWSNFERMDGWVTLVHLWGYFMVLTSTFSVREGDRRMWNNYFSVSLLVAGIVGIYGFAQLFGFAKIHQGSARIDASLGNAIYLAVYMMFNSFLAIYMAFDSNEKKNINLTICYMHFVNLNNNINPKQIRILKITLKLGQTIIKYLQTTVVDKSIDDNR